MLPFPARNIHEQKDELTFMIDVLNVQVLKKVTDIPEIVRTETQSWLEGLKSEIQNLEMKRTQERIKKVEMLLAPVSHPFESFSLPDLVHQLEEIISAIVADLEEKQFFYMPPEFATYYDQDDLFGIADFFPKANEEIKMAGNCYATGNNTACVFHLMRAVEIGAKAMVSALKAQKYLVTPVNIKGAKKMVKKPVELCDWKMLRDGLTKALTGLEKGTRTSLSKKETLEFYSHAISQFSHFKDAWRNSVAHSRKIYQTGETSDIMNNARQFLQHLAQRVKE
jgi:hypothetical protein